MKIFAVNQSNSFVQSRNNKQNVQFKGLLEFKSSSSDSYSYHGCQSGSSIDGNYEGYDDREDYVYHPFIDETEEEVDKALRENNYSSDYASYGYGGGRTVSTDRGSTLPIKKAEWAKYSKNKYSVSSSVRNFIEMTLDRFGLSQHKVK